MIVNRIIDKQITLSQSATNPISLQTAKDWIRVSGTDDDNLITQLIIECIEAIELFCGISIRQKSVTIIIDVKQQKLCEFIEIKLPYGPIISSFSGNDLITVKYKNGVKQSDFQDKTVDVDFFYDGLEDITIKFPVPGVYKITYNAGYTSVPNLLLHAIRAEIAFRYEYRGDAQDVADNRLLCATAMAKAKPFKNFQWE
jgi:hypothetical protein